MELLRPVLVVITILAGVFLFTPYEAFLEGVIALAIVVAAMVGFLMHPRREVFYVRTAVRLIDPDRRPLLEQDFLAVRVELVRLWLLFVPAFLSVAVLVFFAASGPAKFSYLNWLFSSRYAFIVLLFCQYPPLLVFALLVAWIDERRVMRDAGACTAKSFSIHRAPVGWVGRVSYLFMGEHGEYYGGDCLYFGLRHPRELATIVFHNVQTPELNKIVMGFLFHRLIIMGRGVTDLERQTAAAQAALAEATPVS
ncbi:MAG TPA: hypothetical protein VNH65_08475 [Candidatus Acidoferrum sp.]|nr:hypothetical protein [Candidatus Acidoferrum sp.]